MKCLIIGKGILGERHADLLSKLGADCYFVSRRSQSVNGSFPTVSKAFEVFHPDLVWVCTETSAHFQNLKDLDLVNYSGVVLVEKPLYSNPEETRFKNLDINKIFVTYNFRIHPFITYLKNELLNQKVISVNAYVGKDLSDWGRNRDYQSMYSAFKEQGGGSLRDLSHEIDFCQMLFGNPVKMSSYGDFSNSLSISSDELYQIHYKSSSGASVLLELNYLDKLGRRWLLINTDKHTYMCNFYEGSLMKDKDVLFHNVKISDTYPVQAELAFKGRFENFCTYHEGQKVMSFIELAESCNWREK